MQSPFAPELHLGGTASLQWALHLPCAQACFLLSSSNILSLFTHILHHGNMMDFSYHRSHFHLFQGVASYPDGIGSTHNLIVKGKHTSLLHNFPSKWNGICKVNSYQWSISVILLITVQYVDTTHGNSLPLGGNFVFPHPLLISSNRGFMLTHI